MPQAFLILLAGGIMLAVAITDPEQVELRWLRLAGILALCFAALGMYFAFATTDGLANRHVLLAIAILGQLGFSQANYRLTQRLFAVAAVALTIVAVTISPLAAVAIAATSGLCLMDMLLGHAYLTAAKMTMAPFRRLNFALAGALVASAVLSVIAMLLQQRHPIELFWQRYLLFISTRWFIGLIVPTVFVYMAHDCIRRRATQSATGILYVAGVLIFIGEILALHLARETGLPL
jgi:hypothetical protein